MTITTVDFKDKKFQDLVKYYCLNSSPFEEVDSLFSISSVNLESERYINKLSRCDLSICATSDSGEYIFFAFFNEKENEIDLHFAFPNQIKSFSTEKPDIVSTNKEKLLKHYEEIKI